MVGIRMSISTTSGRSRRTASTASPPSPASPTTSIPRAVRIIRNPIRTSAWSSAITTRGSAHGRSNGILARTRNPPPSRRRASRSPPYTATRWRNPSSPRPSPSGPGWTSTGQHARPGVEHLDPQRVVGVPDRHLRLHPVAVLERVGQRLLDDPVRRDVHAGRQRPGLTRDAYVDRQAGERDPVDQRARPAQTGLRRQLASCRQPSADGASSSRAGAAARSSCRDPLPRPRAAPPRRRPVRVASTCRAAPAWMTITLTL